MESGYIVCHVRTELHFKNEKTENCLNNKNDILEPSQNGAYLLHISKASNMHDETV